MRVANSKTLYARIAVLNRIFIAAALAFAAIGPMRPAAAQTGATLNLRHLETEAFPIIAGTLDARDANGAPIAELQSEAVQVLEDGTARPISQLRAVEPGLRIILVLNPAEPFGIRDSQANTRFDYVKQQLVDWAGGLPADQPLSLITPDGLLAEDASPAVWLSSLESIPNTYGGLEVSSRELLQALELAAQPGAQAGMGVAVWWITATPRAEVLAGTADWQASLAERGIPLFVWQIDSPSTFESEAAVALQSFAQASGGQWFAFSGNEEFPAPENYFAPFRQAYFFRYDSLLHSAGTHEVQLQAQIDGATVISQTFSFDLEIQPPNPILVTPPTQIQRGPSPTNPQQLAPFSQPIEILVEFPDNFQRDLVRTTLYVDGTLASENRSAPFTRFVWDLSGYRISQQVILRVEAEDELGLVGSSIEFPVQVRAKNPLTWYQALLARGGMFIAVSGVLLAAAAFALVMLLSGRLRPGDLAARRLFRRRAAAIPVADPLSDSPLGSAEAGASLPAAPKVQGAIAYLQRLNMQDTSDAPNLLPLMSDELSIGSDAGNEVVINEESVSPRHARLAQTTDTEFLVTDLGTEAGTWVNYAPVSLEGSHLRDGDLLHIGRVAFRFLLAT